MILIPYYLSSQISDLRSQISTPIRFLLRSIEPYCTTLKVFKDGRVAEAAACLEERRDQHLEPKRKAEAIVCHQAEGRVGHFCGKGFSLCILYLFAHIRYSIPFHE